MDFTKIAPDLPMVLPTALLFGPVFGFVAVVFMIAIRKSLQFAGASNWTPSRLIFVAALVTGIFGIFVPEVLGLGSGPLRVILMGAIQIGIFC